ncbi:MAG: hypothetical protein IH598_06620 [Bacteroidales bacterium]|nr:hypothetical protein [Bacteroidales bacterium]
MPELTLTDLPGVTTSANNIYDGNALWGYMNGGADLYLEYGFEGLRVQEIEIESTVLKLEIYRMESPLAAFGMMSIKRFRCNESSLFVAEDCLTAYQYQAAKGSFYLNVINFTGSEEDIEKTKTTAKKLLQLIAGSDLIIPAFTDINEMFVDHGALKFVRGTLGLQNGISKWIGLFEGFSEFEIYYLPLIAEPGRIYFADVFFPDPETRSAFIRKNFSDVDVFPAFQPIENKTFGIIRLSETSIRLVELGGERENFAEMLAEFGF